MRRFLAGFAAIAAALIATTQPAAACAGLIGPNGAVNLLRTTTFAGYHNGVEHYVTSFQFAGGSGQFGSLIPLPGVPDKVEKGGAEKQRGGGQPRAQAHGFLQRRQRVGRMARHVARHPEIQQQPGVARPCVHELGVDRRRLVEP